MRDDPVEFHLPLGAIVVEVNTGIEVGEINRTIGGNRRVPLARIVPDKVVDLRGQWFLAGDAGIGVGPEELQLDDGRGFGVPLHGTPRRLRRRFPAPVLRERSEAAARRTFSVSLVYLFALFLAMLVDRAL